MRSRKISVSGASKGKNVKRKQIKKDASEILYIFSKAMPQKA